MPPTPQNAPDIPASRKQFLILPVVLLAILCVLFFRSFLPGVVHFNNDTPLGVIKSLYDNLGTAFSGRWSDLNSLGLSIGAATPSISPGLLWALGAVGFAKFYAPIALLILGLCAWFFFRQLGLSPLACVLGGLAAALNSDFFSTACWGVASQPIAFGMCYLALAALSSNAAQPHWAKVALAGVAVGFGVIEGLDQGAIFSLCVATYAIFQALRAERGSWLKRSARGALGVVVIALFAGFVAAQTLTALIGTQIKGVAGMQDTGQSKAARWDWATQWSLPKREILELVVPGLFGFRMDTPDGGAYWGAGGRDAAWDRYFQGGQQGPPPGPGQFIRYGGGGLYAGILVVLVAAWAGAQALRKQGSVFSPPNQKALWFWLGLMLVSLLLAFGRYAPFYWFLYQLPYFSTIRNPAKFMHVFTWALVVVFAYGVHGLSRSYIKSNAADPSSPLPAPGESDKARGARGLAKTRSQPALRLSSFDRKWTIGCFAVIGLSLLGWLIYASSRPSLENYLQTVQFGPEMAKEIAGFSIEHAGLFVLLLAVATWLVTLVLRGAFSGARAKWGGICLGLFLVADLAWANQPWIIYWNYKEKYATNPIINLLRQQPYEHRVDGLPQWFLDPWVMQQLHVDRRLADAEQYFRQLYEIEWKQHQFQYYSVQCLGIVQMPRVPADLDAFERALHGPTLADLFQLTPRRWELTNTRYLLGAAPWLDLLNQGMDPQQHRFRIVSRFDILPKPGIAQPTKLEDLTAVPATNGTYALFEFTGALPRVKLYTNWQVSTNDQATLKELASPAFDPAQTVLISNPLPPPSRASAAHPPPSTNSVEFASYAPVRIVLEARASDPSVLLLNDRFDANWKVSVDGKPATLLRCNYIMRGVQIPQGEHRVEFRFAPPVLGLYVSLSALVVAILLAGYLVFPQKPRPPSQPADPAQPARPKG